MGSTDMRPSSSTLALAVVAVAAVVMFAQADELKDLSSADVAPQVEQQKDRDVKLGESGFFGGATSGSSMDNALLTSGTFTMMSSNGLEEEEELGERGRLLQRCCRGDQRDGHRAPHVRVLPHDVQQRAVERVCRA